ncbi:serine hydrolase domain-containing protein [Acinetobacter sp. c1-l78]|uniref:serine hydrolase domain-containing protein n=1 Tax=Acinetobacter sp. c1-l78 TaxID=3342803 RepID=UPI0035BA194E
MSNRHKKLFSDLNRRDAAILVTILVLVTGFIYLYSAKYYLLNRWVYIAQAPFAERTITCSEKAPDFMHDTIRNMIYEQKSMSNQLVFRESNGHLHHCESGWEDGFRGTSPINVDSQYRYASVSKVLTSAIILNLINQGKLELNTKLVDILKIPPANDKRINDITIEMLLQHSAGFDRFKTYTPMLTMDVKPWCPNQLEELATTQLDFTPNNQFSYSNVGYCLLGAIAEKVSGKDFKALANDLYHLQSRNIDFVAEGYLPNEIKYDFRYEDFYGESYTTHFDFKDSLYAVGGLAGSAKSMVLLTADMLKEKPYNVVSRNNTPCNINVLEGCYGYGMLPYEQTGKNFILYGKSGFFPGVNTDIFVDSNGGILAAYRASSTPNYKIKDQLKLQIYQSLLDFYHI